MRLGDFAAASEAFRQAADLAPGIKGYQLCSAQLLYQQVRSGGMDGS